MRYAPTTGSIALTVLIPSRELYIKSGQGFLLVFSITSLSSLQELNELRDQILRIKGYDPQNLPPQLPSPVPIVLVGNKSDLEADRAVSRSRGFAVSQRWGNCPYYETSARRRTNVDEVFKDLCRQIIRKELEATDGDRDRRGGRSHRTERRRQPRRTGEDRDMHGGYNSGDDLGRSQARRNPRRQRRRSRDRRCVIL